MKEASPCDTTSVGAIRELTLSSYGPTAQNRSVLTMRFPSGEYRPEQSRHCKDFSALFFGFMQSRD